MCDQSLAAPRPWIVSARYDAFYFIGSVSFSLIFYLLYNETQEFFLDTDSDAAITTIFSLLFAGLFDYPHILQTFTRTHLDQAERQRHRFLYSYGVVLFIAAGFLINALRLERYFFLFLATFGIWHIMRQNIGLMMLYRVRARQYDRPSAQADKALFYTANLYFVVCRLCHDNYYGFAPTTRALLELFLPFTQAFFMLAVLAVGFFTGLLYWRERRLAWVKLLFMGLVLSWQGFAYLWIVAPHPIVTAAETIYHNVQYQGWILRYQKRRYPSQPRLPLFSTATALAYGGLFCGVMVLSFHHRALSWFIWPFIMMVCFHYVVDGLIWRLKRDPWLVD